MGSDLRFAVRSTVKHPGFAMTTIAALALGIGANTAIFSIVNAILLNPEGVSDPDRIVAVRARYEKLNLTSIPLSAPDFADVRNSRQLFEHTAVMAQVDFHYTAGPVPERLVGALVSLEWFAVFGARPRIGRVFRAEEDQPNANQVAVLAWSCWHRLFGADPNVVGRTIELSRMPYRIVGVMGPEFRRPGEVDVWTPMGLSARDVSEQNRFNEGLFAAARMKPGVSIAQANSWIRILAERVKNNGTDGGGYAKDSRWGMFAVPLTDFTAGDSKTPILILLGAVGFVLLIACSNIAGLMLARASSRAKEIAIRAALGAGRGDLIRQTMWESLMLAFAGGGLGLVLADGGIRVILWLAPEGMAPGLVVSLDRWVLVFTASIAILAGVLFGIAPAWQIARLDRYELLKEGGRSATSTAARQRLRAALVVGEVALALVLLVGTGLFLRSLARLQQAGTGFDPRGVMTATVSLPEAQYKEPEKRAAFFRAVLERLSDAPGVTVAGGGIPLPFSGGGASGSFQIEGRTTGPGDPGPHGDVRYVTAGYFAALRIPVRSGRVFSDQDRMGSAPVIVIDENLARQYWPGENPVGQRIRRGSGAPWSTIVGVAGHIKNSDLAVDSGKGMYYFAVLQQPIPFLSFVARTTVDPATLAGTLRDAIGEADPSLPAHHLRSMADMVRGSLAPRRFVVALLGFFALAALLLAVLGLYGVISYSVAQRTREIGIRIALGARGREVLGLVVGQGMRLALAGAAIGFVAAFSLSSFLSKQLFQVSPFDPLTSAAMALVLITAALLASFVPALRATRVDPIVALRSE